VSKEQTPEKKAKKKPSFGSKKSTAPDRDQASIGSSGGLGRRIIGAVKRTEQIQKRKRKSHHTTSKESVADGKGKGFGKKKNIWEPCTVQKRLIQKKTSGRSRDQVNEQIRGVQARKKQRGK